MVRNSEDGDIELGLSPASENTSTPYLSGYPSFAAFISSDADAAIYRRYERLSARNLLYLQSELHSLEGELQSLDTGDVREKELRDQASQKIARYWQRYSRVDCERANEHRILQEKIRAKIKECHEALVLENKVLALNPPTTRTLRAFKWWYNPGVSRGVPVLWGKDENLFQDERDFVALAPAETDRLNIFLQTHFGWFFKEKRENDARENDDDIFYFPAQRIQRAGAVISIVLSAVLLIGAIACLVRIERKNTSLRVGIIIIFTSVFAAVVGLLTSARRAEIFGSTAAYAAVLCVFMSNTP